MIIAMASAKGGVGKSTIAAHLADEWHMRHARVLVVDADPQQSLVDWASVRSGEGGEDAGPSVVAMGKNLGTQLDALAAGYDVVIVDTPGRQSAMLGVALGVADVALVPCGSGTTDLWAASQTAETIQDAQAMRRGAPVARLLLNRVDGRTVLGRHAREGLAEAGIPLLETTLGDRVAYVEAIAGGIGVTRYEPGSAAARELRALVDELDALREVSRVA